MSSAAATITVTVTAAIASATTSTIPEGYTEKPPIFKTLGIILAIVSGLFIGLSFVMKKKGLLAANLKDGKEAGEGYGYLKNYWWWGGMGLMILGEICNFAAYLFAEAILVTPLGALSVVITAILSGIFLKERLSFVGKIGCFECIVGSTVIVINAPKQAQVSTIEDMQNYVISPGFLSFTGVIIITCIGIVWFAAPRWGNQSMLVYLSVCSLIGGLSVACIQGIGAAIIAQANGIPQFNQWFTYVLIVFVIITLLVEIVYLNKALNIFNAAIVTPTYYVFFTSSTIVTSAILFRGFKGSPSAIATVVMGFLQICAGVVLLQLSKSAKNVPDTEVFRGDLDQVRTVAEQEEPESEPKADAIRGTAAIIRRISAARQKMEAAEAHRVFEDRLRDSENRHLGIRSDEHIEWDGIRRRVTWGGAAGTGARPRRNTTAHPPLGLPRIPDLEEGIEEEAQANNSTSKKGNRRRSMSLDAGFAPGAPSRFDQEIDPEMAETIWQRTKSLFVPRARSNRSMTIGSSQSNQSTIRVVSGDNSSHPYQMAPLDTGAVAHNHSSPQLHITPSSPTNQTFHGTNWHYGSSGSSTYNTSGVSPGYLSDTPPLAPPSPICTRESDSIKSGKGSEKTAKRQFSFQSMFSRAHTHNRTASTESAHTIRRMGLGSRKGSRMDNLDGTSGVATNSGGSHRVGTEEELLGLVKGDTKRTVREDSLPPYTDGSDDEDRLVGKEKEKEIESYTMRRTSTPTSEEGYNDEKPDKGKRSEKSTIRLV